MKRGLLPLLIFLLLIPIAAAQTSVLDIFFGSSKESLLLLKFMYAALVFVIFYKVSKESVFKDTAGTNKNERFATAFSLILALLTMRFTPDVVVAGFGWVITLIAPFAVFYSVTGMFIKKVEGKVSWLRIILASLATLLTLAALGSYKGFSTNIRGVPLGGGFLDELFSDLHYFLFYKLDWFWAMFIVAVVAYLIYYLVGKFGGGKASEAGKGIGFGEGLLAVLGIGLLVALLGYLLGGGLGFLGGYGIVLLLLILVALALWGAYKQKKRLVGAGEGVDGIIGWTFLDAIPMFLKGFGLLLKAFFWDAPATIINLFTGRKKEKGGEEKLGKSSLDITSPKKGDRFLSGKTIKVRFLVSGKQPALFHILFSENGSWDKAFHPMEDSGRRIVLSAATRSFDFIAPDIESEKCYIGIQATDADGRILVFEKSGKFAIGEKKEKGPSLWQRMKDKLKSKKPEGEEPEKEEGKLSVVITSPKEGDTFAAGSMIPVTFVAEGKKPASYLVQFSSSGTHAYNRKWEYVHAPGGRFTLGPDTTQFDLPAPLVNSDTCYIMLQAIDEKGKTIGFFTSSRFGIRLSERGKAAEEQAPVDEEERTTEAMEQPLKGKVAGLIAPPVVLISPQENRRIQAGKMLEIAWRVEGIQGGVSADALLGYSTQGPSGPYSPIARVKMEEISTAGYSWKMPDLLDGTELYLRIYIPEIGADRVFGPFSITGSQASFLQRLKERFQKKPEAPAPQAPVPEERETPTTPGTRTLVEAEWEEEEGETPLATTAPRTTVSGEERPTLVPEEGPNVEYPMERYKQSPLMRVKELGLVLLFPVEDKFITTPTIEVAWQFLNVERNFMTDLRIIMTANEERKIRDVKSGIDGNTRWKVPEVEKDTDMYLTFVIAGGMQKKFGPFTIQGKETVDIRTSLDALEIFLGQIKLPGKSRNLKKMNVGSFFYYLVNTNELQKYADAAARLQDIAHQLENPAVQRTLGNLYSQYIEEITEIQKTMQQLEGLERRKELRARLLEILREWEVNSQNIIKVINKNLLDDFRKHFQTDIRNLTAARVVNDIDYLSWVMDHAREIDRLMGIDVGNMNLDYLYRFVEFTRDKTDVLYKQLGEARILAQKIKKQLKAQ